MFLLCVTLWPHLLSVFRGHWYGMVSMERCGQFSKKHCFTDDLYSRVIADSSSFRNWSFTNWSVLTYRIITVSGWFKVKLTLSPLFNIFPDWQAHFENQWRLVEPTERTVANFTPYHRMSSVSKQCACCWCSHVTTNMPFFLP